MLARSCYGIVAVPSAIAVTAIVYFYYYISIVWLSEILPIDLGKDPGNLLFFDGCSAAKKVRIIGLVSMLSNLEDILVMVPYPHVNTVQSNVESPRQLYLELCF